LKNYLNKIQSTDEDVSNAFATQWFLNRVFKRGNLSAPFQGDSRVSLSSSETHVSDKAF